MTGAENPALALLRRSLATLQALNVIPAVSPVLEDAAEVVTTELRAAVLSDIPAFAASGNPNVLPELDRHVVRHVSEICRLFAGEGITDLSFVAQHAQQRAEQRLPLELTILAYRCGQRVLSQWLSRSAVLVVPEMAAAACDAVEDFVGAYTNLITVRATSAYVDHTRRLAEAEGDSRKELLHFLLAGYDESDGRVAALLKRSGYLEPHQAYAVVAALPVNASEMDNAPRAQRLVSALSDAFTGTSFRVLAGLRDGYAVAVVSDRRRQSGWTAAQSPVSSRIVPLLMLLGPAVVMGVSADHPSTAFVPKAMQEAKAALSFARTDRRVVLLADLSIRDRLVQGGMDRVRSAPPPWIAALATMNAESRGSVVQTLRALAAANLNVQAAARALGKHPNTIYARIERIAQITGQDPRSFGGLTELSLAADCWKMPGD